MSELRPCPFCGSEVDANYDAEGILFSITCPHCSATGPMVAGTNQGMIDEWNRRAEAENERLRKETE